MRRFVLLSLLVLVGCEPPRASSQLLQARSRYVTRLAVEAQADEPLEIPPPGALEVVRYSSPVGRLPAYLSSDPQDGQKHPAIIWITGGDCNTIGDVWTPRPPENDQTAAAYRRAGIVMLYPSLRGGNENPGVREGFYGEVDDVLAAAEFLAQQPYVDPQRIYLGGHSTGGTLVMLCAAASNRFRAVFSFGPIDDVSGYSPRWAGMVRTDNEKEVALRSPGRWLHSIQSPTFVFEGERGNDYSLLAMQSSNKNPLAKFYLVPDRDHFDILAPVNRLLAQKILADTGPTSTLSVTLGELQEL